MFVVFGVFLVSATILGVVLTALVGLIRDLPSNLGDGRIALITALAVIYAAAVVVGVFLVWGSALKLRRESAPARATAAAFDRLPGTYSELERCH